MNSKAPSSIWTNPVHFLAFGFGSGAAPVAPGTFGTVVAIPVYLLMRGLPLWTYVIVTVAFFAVGIWLCHVTARDLGVHDHSGIVWDEIVGYLITMALAPPGWVWVVAGFALFRLFDIWKPWPIRWLDRHMGGGLGIMLDDALAGVYGLVVMALLAAVL